MEVYYTQMDKHVSDISGHGDHSDDEHGNTESSHGDDEDQGDDGGG